MRLKKTIWMPIVLGAALGILDFVSLSVNFIIPLGPYGATGPQEVFITMSAALGGPLGLSITCLLQEMGHHIFFLKDLFAPEQKASTGTLYSIADFSAHILAALPVAYGYKFLHQRAKKAFVFFGGWILISVFYYALLVLMQFLLIGFVINLPPLFVLFRNFLPEFLVVTIISTLIWVALPGRYRRPLWIEVQPAAPINEDSEVYKETQT
jgi:hypothetical protein